MRLHRYYPVGEMQPPVRPADIVRPRAGGERGLERVAYLW